MKHTYILRTAEGNNIQHAQMTELQAKRLNSYLPEYYQWVKTDSPVRTTGAK